MRAEDLKPMDLETDSAVAATPETSLVADNIGRIYLS